MTPGRLLYLLRRDWERGWVAAWHERAVSPQITRWRNPWADRLPEPIPVHVLVGREQFRLMLWMLASWFHFTGRNWRVVVHEDGTLTEEQAGCLRDFLPGSRLVSAREGDEAAGGALVSKPRCRWYRERHPLARKIFDVPLVAESKRFLLLDADVVFFRKPVEMLDWVDGKRVGCWFNEDAAEASPLSQEEVKRVLGVGLWARVNSGICLIERGTVDLDFCERALVETSLADGNLWRIEQTLFALCASRVGVGGLLPAWYEVSLTRHRRTDAVARHYVGAVRDQFFAEGIRELKTAVLS